MTAIIVLLIIIVACLLCFKEAEPVKNALSKAARDGLTVWGCILVALLLLGSLGWLLG